MAQEEGLLSLDDETNNNAKRSLYLIIVVEFFTAMLAICNGANLLMQLTSNCKGFRFLGITLILIGVGIFVLLWTNCSFARANEQSSAGCKFLCCSAPLVFASLVLGIFAMEVSSRKGGGGTKSEGSYEVYDVGSFSKWMQRKVGVDPAFEPQENGNLYTTKNEDCNRWDNDPNILCFNCETCKAGFLQDVTSHWRSTGLGLILMVVLVLVLGIPFICLTMISSDSFHACLMAFEYGTFVVALGLGWKLLDGISSRCPGFRFLRITLVVIGASLLVFFYIGCATVDSAPEAALGKSLCCSVPLIVALAALGIFTLAVSNKGGGKSIPGRSYKEYRVESYSKWMRNKVNDTHNWETYYKKAVVKNHVCEKFGKEYKLDTLDQFHKRKMSHFESGCCKPSEDCNFSYTSPSIWEKPTNVNNTNNDCNRWDNDPNVFCFNCQSCKAAFLQDLKSRWSVTGIILVVIVSKHFLLGICLICLLCRDS
ncbi:Tetraspanin-9 [Bienertia sinuspersici]